MHHKYKIKKLYSKSKYNKVILKTWKNYSIKKKHEIIVKTSQNEIYWKRNTEKLTIKEENIKKAHGKIKL